jgi:hypothetical protein
MAETWRAYRQRPSYRTPPCSVPQSPPGPATSLPHLAVLVGLGFANHALNSNVSPARINTVLVGTNRDSEQPQITWGVHTHGDHSGRHRPQKHVLQSLGGCVPYSTPVWTLLTQGRLWAEDKLQPSLISRWPFRVFGPHHQSLHLDAMKLGQQAECDTETMPPTEAQQLQPLGPPASASPPQSVRTPRPYNTPPDRGRWIGCSWVYNVGEETGPWSRPVWLPVQPLPTAQPSWGQCCLFLLGFCLCCAPPRPHPASHLLHGFEQCLPIVLERHDELQLCAPRLHGCRKRERETGHLWPQAPPQGAGPAPGSTHWAAGSSGCNQRVPILLMKFGFWQRHSPSWDKLQGGPTGRCLGRCTYLPARCAHMHARMHT